MEAGDGGIVLAPFRALRYETGRLEDPGDVWAPPYDVISTEEARALRHRHPKNIVRITLPEPGEPDRYTAAGRTFRSWIEDGTLVREPEPSVYVHRHRFTAGGGTELSRTGLWALLRLVPPDAGRVLPHERTLRGPKLDRLSLMRATRAQLSAVFLIASDPEGGFIGLLREWSQVAGLERAEFPEGESHEIWRVGGERLGGLRILRDQALLIADGHHRYETALAYRDELIGAGAPRTGRGGHEFVLVCVVSERDPGLRVDPTHRVLTGLEDPDWDSALASLRDRCSIDEIPESGLADLEGSVSDLAGRPAFLLVVSGREGAWLIEDRAAAREGPDPEVAALARMASTFFHELFLPRALGLDAEEQEAAGHLSYTRDAREALRRVRRGSAQAAALLAAPRIEQVRQAVAAGSRLPPKTTFFWPKVPTGPALHLIDSAEEIEVPRDA